MVLISPDGLQALLPQRPAILDTRWQLGGPPGRHEYNAGHIPGAAFVELDEELSGAPGVSGRHPLPDQAAFERSMRRAGVSNDRPVAVYDAGNSMAAARGWWLLRYFGHEHVHVLDGGFAAWLDSGYPVETETPAIEVGDFVGRPGGMPLLDAASAAQIARSGVLIDARAPERFRGEVEPIDPVAGHIPGALNRPSSENVDQAGRFRNRARLRAEFEQLGVTPERPAGAYCGSGVVAAHEVLALELAGLPAALYVGSWSEWITDPQRPVATGP